MTPQQFRAALNHLGLTQEQAAEWMDRSVRAVHGYANGEPIPKIVAMLLRTMIKQKLKPEDVR